MRYLMLFAILCLSGCGKDVNTPVCIACDNEIICSNEPAETLACPPIVDVRRQI